MPRHIGIILDGNRRHGRALGIARPRDSTISAPASSTKSSTGRPNWCRDSQPVGFFDRQFAPAGSRGFRTSWRASRPSSRRWPLPGDPPAAGAGARDRLSCDAAAALLDAITAAERATLNYDLELDIAVAYGGRQEIADAVRLARRFGRAGRDIGRGDRADDARGDRRSPLYTAGLPDLDLIIRTSGEIRLSGFLLWQSAHSEFYFTDVLWPAFRKIDFLRAIRSYQQASAGSASDGQIDPPSPAEIGLMPDPTRGICCFCCYLQREYSKIPARTAPCSAIIRFGSERSYTISHDAMIVKYVMPVEAPG